MARTTYSFFLEEQQRQALRRRQKIWSASAVALMVIGGVPLGGFCLVQWFPEVCPMVTNWLRQMF